MALLVVCAGCATQTGGGLASKSAGEIPTLTARLARDSANPQLQAQLGAAYLQVGRPADARPLLEKAVASRPQDGTSIINLGLTYEAMERYPDARRLYEQYLKVGRSRSLRNDLNQRLQVVQRKEMELAARQAVARERELSSTPPRPRTVAVFPFRMVQPDSTLRPLGRVLAELLVVDLSQTDRLTVLERLQVQLLIEEMDLAAAGLVDPRQGVRSGRMLSAERIVQGTVGGSRPGLELSAAVVQTQSGAQAPAARPLTASGQLTRFMDAEKQLVFAIYENMGVQLTVAERERINRRPTENLQAILAYGLGLEALDAGNYVLAGQHFAEAARIDPSFTLAKDRADQMVDAATASTLSTTALIEKAGIENTQPATRASDFFLPSILTRDPVAEVLGSEDVRRATIIELIFRRPN